MPPMPRISAAVLEIEIVVAPLLVLGVGRRRGRRRRPAWRRETRACRGRPDVRRRSSTGVRSAPPPNHALVVTTKRVFMCTAGTLGLCRWAMSEMPDAQNRGSASAPGISLRNSGANSPNTVETCTPTFSNTRPLSIDMTPPPPGAPAGIGARPGACARNARPLASCAAHSPAIRPRAPRTPRRCRRAAIRTRRGHGSCGLPAFRRPCGHLSCRVG